jgi:broad-specificity NMP kinase
VLLLITGASGVGKSTARRLVDGQLSPRVECAELAELDPPRQGVTKVWRQQTAELAVQRAVELQSEGRHLLLAGDPVPAIEIVAAPSAPRLDSIAVCLLDADPEAQASRLSARGEDPALFVHHQAFADWMRRQTDDPLHMSHVVSDGGWSEMRWDRLDEMVDAWTMETIDTTGKTPEAVADEVLRWCRRALSGMAPVMTVPAAG